jgi:hypothetical protein
MRDTERNWIPTRHEIEMIASQSKSSRPGCPAIVKTTFGSLIVDLEQNSFDGQYLSRSAVERSSEHQTVACEFSSFSETHDSRGIIAEIWRDSAWRKLAAAKTSG